MIRRHPLKADPVVNAGLLFASDSKLYLRNHQNVKGNEEKMRHSRQDLKSVHWYLQVLPEMIAKVTY